ncbi:helix-turn-helix domain-containing protein [Ramlibacter algicola]|uniref:DUF4115 domain-containing protein n=1 Tax=Ramlibacter algicola TaxID=2795217 RepID=A0A934Q2B9_9BURK|nr:helix-turn-helix domain-containing protein [Ramlibacter algicola]MBK0393231.1 DUF4115 domain-containing protein [Ramlibacter algicola]
MSEAVAVESAGALLRQAREASGLHVAALAVSLKVPVRKLEALENDRYDELTDAVFARALASSVCRTLKVDARPILDRLPQTNAPRLVQDREGINAPFRAPGDPVAPRWFDQWSRPPVIAMFALLIAALVVVLMPRRDDVAAVKTDSATPVAGMTAPALPPVASTTEPVAAPLPVASEPATPVAARAASAPAAAASMPATQAAVAAPATTPASAPATGGTIVFRTSAPSWVEVMDAKGNVALRRLMAAGETAGASGPLPLAVTVGSANATTVEVRGKPFALAPALVKDNVARFDIK